MYESLFKRLIDIVLSAFGIVVLAIPMLIIAILIKLDSPGKILFKQERVGKNMKSIYILKFRSMKSDAPKNTPTHMLQNPDTYITKMGKILRRTSLDELPQFFCIFKGDMSIIGPRPALFNQTDLIAERDKYGANNIKPGLTGLAQINGRDELPIDLKAKFDGEYVQKMSFWFDVKIFFGTILSVIKREGIVEGVTSERKVEKEVIGK